MRVLVYHEGFYPASGGVEAHVRNLCTNLPCSFRIVSDDHGPSVDREPIATGLDVVRIGPRNPVNDPAPSLLNRRGLFPYRVASDWIRFRRLRSYLRRAECDLMHFHGMGIGTGLWQFITRLSLGHLLPPVVKGVRPKVPKVLTVHGMYHGPDDLVHRYQDRFFAAFDDLICVDANLVPRAVEIASRSGAQVHYVPNSVDTELFRPSPLEPGANLRVGFVGRLEKSRGVPHLVSLAENLPSGVELRMALSASHSERERHTRLFGLRNVSAALNVHQRHMPGFYASIDVLFNPIEVPGISRASLEAMACGKPVVMFRNVARHPVEHAVTGFLIEPRQEEILGLFSDLTNRQETLRTMGTMARKKVDAEFSNSVVLPRVLEVYRGLLDGRRVEPAG